MELTIGHLYPAEMNLYGDRGNILCLTQRCRWRGIEAQVRPISLGEPWPPDLDLLFFGGGPDAQQKGVAQDLLEVKGEALRRDVEGGLVALAICGGFQLLCRYYRPAEGPDLPGLGLFDAWTVHSGARAPRCIGNVVVEWEGSTLVGFENHGGRTYLGSGCRPLGRVRRGHGNNSRDKTEGAIYRNVYASYLHGPLLPKNPRLADHLLRLALERRYGAVDLPPLDDAQEFLAHAAAERRWGG
ncbi:MAG: glutamine amidotransferase [Dehalococcoidia bacterium]|nr:glutamine amidotransferase [Dehalococcoidia bacterium]